MTKDFNAFTDVAIAESPRVSTKFQAEQQSLPGVFENIQVTLQEEKQESVTHEQVKKIIEALLFASNEPLPFNKIREIIDTAYVLKPRVLRELINELQQDYISQQRSFRLEEIAQGYLLRTCEEYAPFIDLLYRNKRSEKLSPAAAEVLAIIAYKNPITRTQVEAIRGVDSSGIMQSLLERQLIEPVGRLEAPGRPTLYSTSKDFLKHFGLKDLHDLPTLN